MALSPEQKTALKNDIAANTNQIGGVQIKDMPNNSDANDSIAKWYNALASPDFTVWRTNVTRKEVLQNGFDWTRLDNLSVGKARVWNDIFVEGQINPAKANVRTGIDSVWVGTQADLDVRAAVYVHCKKLATIVQKLLSTGVGTVASPATMTDGLIESFVLTYLDVEQARAA